MFFYTSFLEGSDFIIVLRAGGPANTFSCCPSGRVKLPIVGVAAVRNSEDGLSHGFRVYPDALDYDHQAIVAVCHWPSLSDL